MAKKLKDLPVGAKVYSPNSKFLGEPVVVQIAHKKSDRIKTITADIVALRAFDAEEPKNSNSKRRSYGNNRWLHSNIRQFLNAQGIYRFAPQHDADQAPTKEYLWEGHNPYEGTPGFLAGFEKEFIDAILPAENLTAIPSVDGGGTEVVTDKVYLPSITEVGLENDTGVDEGEKWSLFTNNASRIAYPTDSAVADDESGYAKKGEARWYFTRTHSPGSANYVRDVDSVGSRNNASARGGSGGLRPALDLSPDISVSKVGDVYEVEFNASPVVTLNTPDNETYYEGSTLNINGTVNDSDVGDVMIVKYRLAGERERVILTQVSTGKPVDYGKVLTFTKSRFYDGDTAVTNTLVEGQTYTLEVFAQDDKGNTSAVQTRKFKVVPNRPPLIAITETPKLEGGVASSDLSIKGNVNDPDGDEVRLSYKLNDGREVPIVVSDDEFGITLKVTDLKNGRNIVVVIARDEYEAMTTRQVEINLSATSSDTDHIKSKMYYKIDTKGVETDGVLLWLRRPLGDTTDYQASLSIVDKEASESYVKMDKSTAIVQGHNRDEFVGSADEKAGDVRIKLEFDGDTAPIEMVQGVIK